MKNKRDRRRLRIRRRRLIDRLKAISRAMTQAEKLAAIEAHISTCAVCSVANKRANDFCKRGRLMFYDWIELEDPLLVVELDEEQSLRVIAQETERAKKAGNN